MEAAVTESVGKVRSAGLVDVGALLRLFAAAGHEVTACGCGDISTCLERGHVVVLELQRSVLGAAVHVAVERQQDGKTHHRLPFFVIDPALAGTRAEKRASCELLGIAVR